MPIYTRLVCDGHKDSPCKMVNNAPIHAGHTINFDQHEETWGSMVEFVVSNGWEAVGGPGQETTKFYCPSHKRTADVHEFEPDGTYAETCARCGRGSEHRNHKDDNGESFMDTDTVFDRMAFDGSVREKIR